MKTFAAALVASMAASAMAFAPTSSITSSTALKAEKAMPLRIATVDGSSRSKVENLLEVIANLKFPMLFSISTSDREAIYIDGGIGDISQSSPEK